MTKEQLESFITGIGYESFARQLVMSPNDLVIDGEEFDKEQYPDTCNLLCLLNEVKKLDKKVGLCI